MTSPSAVERAAVAGVAAITAVVAAAPAAHSPIGLDGPDRVATAVLAALIVWLVAITRPAAWLPLLLISAFTADTVGRLAAGVAIAGFLVAWPAQDRPGLRFKASALAVGAASTVAVLRIDDAGHTGVSALAVGIAVLVLGVTAFLATDGRRRRTIAIGLGLTGLVLIGTVGLAARQVLDARPHFDAVVALGRDAADAMATSDLDRAERSLREAGTELDAARARLRHPAVVVARHLPGLGPNLGAVEAGLDAGDALTRAGLLVVDGPEPTSIVQAGAVDLDRTNELASVTAAASTTVATGLDRLHAASSTWLAPPARVELDRATAELATGAADLDALAEVLAIAPALVGADEPRSYMILFANPAEARDLGGFVAAYSVIRLRNGAVIEVDAAPIAELGGLGAEPTTLTGTYPQRYLELQPWQWPANLTSTPDLPTVARATNDLFGGPLGHPVHGVIYLDVHGLAALLDLTGPVAASDDLTLDADNAADYFLTRQYILYPDRAERTTVREAALARLVARLATIDLSDVEPGAVGNLRRAVTEQRIAFAPVDPDELAAVDAAGVAGAVEPLDPGVDHLAVGHLNGGPNKLDAYLHRSIHYGARVDPATGAISADVAITLRSDAPRGLGDHVGRNTHGYPVDTNRAVLTVHTPHELVAWSGPEPEPAMTRSFWEFDRWRHERVVIVAPGESVTVGLELAGTVNPADRYRLHVEHQPVVNDDDLEVDLDLGDLRLQRAGELDRDIVLDAADADVG